MKQEYNMTEILLNKMTPSFVTNFEHFLKTKKSCGHNAAKKYLKSVRTIVLYAIANGWMKSDPFVSISTTEISTDPVFLTYPEVEKILKQEFHTERLNVIKDVFLFACFTGIAFGDMQTLDLSHIGEDEDEQLWIRKHRIKSNIKFNVPLTELPIFLLEKYKNHPKCVKSGKLFPIPSNQKMNEYLKEIADICGISKNITTHTARHTFATLSLTQKVSLPVVQKMLGHTKIATTQHYAKVLDGNIKSEMGKMRGLVKTEILEAV